jgi:prepilin-type N-terminal cleavage/methylation domain-containing protein
LKLHNKKGTTLIELIIALAIMTLLFAPIISIIITVNRTFYTTGKLSIAQSYTNMAISIIKRELSSANTINLIDSVGTTSEKKYLYVNNGIIYIRTIGNTPQDKDVLRKPDLDGENMSCSLVFTSSGAKAINVDISINDKTTNDVIFKTSTIVYLQNTPYGLLVPPTAGQDIIASVAEYTFPN